MPYKDLDKRRKFNREYGRRFRRLHPEEARRRTLEYCTRWRARKPTHPCPMCGGPASFTRKYCSYACSNRGHSTKPRMIKSCAICSKPMLVLSWNAAAKYCSRPCLYKHLRRLALTRPVKTEGTQIELALRGELTTRGVSFLANVGVEICRPDMLLPSYKVVIFADGCYWHACPMHCKKLSVMHTKMMQKDRKHDEFLRNRGYHVYRFWEHDINKSPKACIDSIVELQQPISTLTCISVTER